MVLYYPPKTLEWLSEYKRRALSRRTKALRRPDYERIDAADQAFPRRWNSRWWSEQRGTVNSSETLRQPAGAGPTRGGRGDASAKALTKQAAVFIL